MIGARGGPAIPRGGACPGIGRRRLGAVVLGASIAAASPVRPARGQAARPIGLLGALRIRMPLMLVVAPPDRDLPGGEAIGDWAHFRDEALRGRPRGVAAARTTRTGFRDVFAAPALDGDYATFFIRPDRSALVRADLVLDPQTYEAGFAFLGQAAPPGNAGLVATRVRPR